VRGEGPGERIQYFKWSLNRENGKHMELWVSIDLLEGRVVRLVKGELENTLVYSSNPAYVASQLASTDVDGIHIVDIDAALNRGNNEQVIREILKNARPKMLQVGGGLRTMDRIVRMFEQGADRVVLGTILFRNGDLVRELVRIYGDERFLAALDFNAGGIVYEGWTMRSLMTIEEGLKLVDNLSLKYILMTSVERDGTLAGPDLTVFERISPEKRRNIYASGGITTPHEVKHLAQLGYRGVILGRAYYERLAPLKEYVKAAKVA
jgi:phosphoribosylformimino-5-aminoimidazole carboxamide ribotide isomerase